jgi:hypothetical protein
MTKLVGVMAVLTIDRLLDLQPYVPSRTENRRSFVQARALMYRTEVAP